MRGIGYYVAGLKAELQKILGLDRDWAVALVGFGNLGSALFHYKGFARQGFRIVAIFDEDAAKTGRDVGGIPVLPSRDLAREVKARGIQIAIVAVPPEAAQTVTDQLADAGIKAILNFAPARLRSPRDTRLKHVDLTDRARDAVVLPGQGRTVERRGTASRADPEPRGLGGRSGPPC